MKEGFESMRRVGGESDGAKSFDVVEEIPVSRDEKKEKQGAYEETARQYIDRVLVSGRMRRFIGEAVSFQVGESGSGFYYDSIRKKINLDPLWFMERGLSPRMIEWAMYHEGRHSIDRRDDPESFDATLAYCVEKARSFVPQMIEKWRTALDFTDPSQQHFFDSLTEETVLDKDVQETVPRVVAPLVKVYFTTLFNSLDDIWVNKGIPDKAFLFEETAAVGEEIRDLYQRVLFPSVDYREVSHVEQFAYSLLREAMVPEEKVVVNDVVAEELALPRKFLGKEFTARDIVARFLTPRPGADTTHEKRKEAVEKYLMESFDRMVQCDIDAWTPQYRESRKGGQGEGGEGDGKAESQAGQPFDGVVARQKEHEIDHLSPEDIKNIEKTISDAEADAKKNEKNAQMTPEEREKERQANIAKARATKASTENGVFNQPKFNEIMRSRRAYESHKARVTPHIEALARLWRTLIGKGKEIRMVKERFQTQGKLDLKAFVAQYPTLIKGEFNETYEPHFFEKRVGQLIEHITPEEIRVYLNLDLSGSMKEDSGKMTALKDLTVLLNEAFSYLGTMVQNEKESLHDEHAFRVSIEVRGYDTKSAKILAVDHGWVDESLLMSNLDKAGGGGTNSSTALIEVERAVTQLPPEAVQSGKVKVLLFDITDGETKGVGESISILNGLREQYPIITNPLYIGSGDEDKDKKGFETMKQIYGDDAEQVTLETIVEVLTRRLMHELDDMAV